MEQIEELIHRGYIGEYVSNHNGRKVYGDYKRALAPNIIDSKVLPIPRSGRYERPPRQQPKGERPEQNIPQGEIRVIYGVLAWGVIRTNPETLRKGRSCGTNFAIRSVYK